jgi:hypothetical protein
MADDTVDPSSVIINASNSTAHLSSTLSSATDGLTSFVNKLTGAIKDLKNFDEQNSSSVMSLVGLSTEFIGASTAFDKLTSSTNNLRTFTDQFTDFKNMLSNSPAAAQIKVLSGVLSSFGVSSATVANASKDGAKGIMSFAEAFFKSADNGAKLEDAFLSLAAQTGQLGTVQGEAGQNLSSINVLLEKQNKMMVDAATATGQTKEKAAAYYDLLGKIPKELDATVGSTNMLTATMQLAAGTHRDMAAITGDLSEAFSKFGMTGKDALTFTERFTEVSSNLGLRFSDVHNHIMNAADAFKTLADSQKGAFNMTEDVSNIMNTYVKSLMAAGMTGDHALDVMSNMTSQMGKMTVAQKSFLSSQTGGPGGLMGSFQIEKMLNEGNIAGVFDKVQATMKKQFGSIVTLDEASKSESAAAQLQKQTMMLKQGPLGSMVKSDEDARRFLEAIRTGNISGVKKDFGKPEGDTGLKNALDAGKIEQGKTHTILSQAVSQLEAIRSASETMAYGMAQNTFSEITGTGNKRTDTAAQLDLRKNLSSTRAKYETYGSSTETTAGSMVRNAGENITSIANTASSQITVISSAVMNKLDKLSNSKLNERLSMNDAKIKEAAITRGLSPEEQANRVRAASEAEADKNVINSILEKRNITENTNPGRALGNAARNRPSQGRSEQNENANIPTQVTVSKSGLKANVTVKVDLVNSGAGANSINPQGD